MKWRPDPRLRDNGAGLATTVERELARQEPVNGNGEHARTTESKLAEYSLRMSIDVLGANRVSAEQRSAALIASLMHHEMGEN